MRGQDQYGQGVALLPQAPQHLEPIELGQAKVEDEQRVVLRRQQVIGGPLVVHAVDGEAGLGQRFDQRFDQRIGQHHIVCGRDRRSAASLLNGAGRRRHGDVKIDGEKKRLAPRRQAFFLLHCAEGARGQGTITILPVTLRASMSFRACGACSSG